jgi:hypothetical protein
LNGFRSELARMAKMLDPLHHPNRLERRWARKEACRAVEMAIINARLRRRHRLAERDAARAAEAAATMPVRLAEIQATIERRAHREARLARYAEYDLAVWRKVGVA